MSSQLPDAAKPPVLVPYMDLGGGLNTRKDPHALARNELAVSVNMWSAYDQALSLRPGNVALITPDGTVGHGLGNIGLCQCRFPTGAGVDVTYLLDIDAKGNVWATPVQGSVKWTKIGSVNSGAQVVTTAQMFDPRLGTVGKQTVYICDGLSIPQMWNGPGTQMQNVPTGTGKLPTQVGGTPITPAFVHTLGNNSHLFYSGDPTNPSAVYISDPFYPQDFTTPAMQVQTNLQNPDAYQPAIIGNNDGVEGGKITGMETLGSVMVIFKEAAIYNMQMTTLLGEVPAWQVIQVSNSIGNLAPRSLARFDSFICFLGIDGVYATDANTAWQVSGDVPAFFDSSLNGNPAQIINRVTPIGVRHGNRYEIFFLGATAPMTSGVWFDFTRQTASGNPAAGQIEGMNVGGAVALRGPLDDGNVAWCDAGKDRVGRFGLSGQGDFGQNITFTFSGKADLFDDVMGADAAIGQKDALTAYLLVELQAQSPPNAALDFVGAVTVNNVTTLQRSQAQLIAQGALANDIWGQAPWGQLQWGPPQLIYNYSVVKIPLQGPTKGYMLQVSIGGSMIVPFVIIGYVVYANLQPPAY